MSDLLLNVDLQEQSPSAEETASGNAIVTLFEIYLENSDLGGTAIDKLYFHDGTKSPADSYGSIQMYSPTLETSWGSTTSTDYTLQTYTPFPFEFNGYERRGKGAIPRPTIRFSNINRDFTVYNTSHEDLLGAKVIRRRTLAKYLGENPPVEFPKEVYYIERLVSETSMMVEYELTTNFDLRGVLLPSRRIIASRCNWKYKDATSGGCDWPTDSIADFTDASGTAVTDQKVYVSVDDIYITAGNVKTGSSATTYSIWDLGDNLVDGRAYTKNHFTEYHVPTTTSFYVDQGIATISSTSSMIEIADIDSASINTGGAIAPTALINDGSGISNSVTTITFDNAIGTIPSNGVVFIDNEQISYTGKTSTTLTGCTRGVNGTTAATHSNNAVITTEAYVSIRGSTVSKWDFGEMALRVKKITDTGSNTQIYVVSPDASNTGVYTGNGTGGYMSITKNRLFKCKKSHTSTAPLRPGSTLGKEYWEVGDVCGKRLGSCRMRFGFNSGAGTVEALNFKVLNGTVMSGVGYTSAPDIGFVGGGGSGAAATCTQSGGVINAITITNAGSGYTSPPTVTLTTAGSSTAAQLVATVKYNENDVPLPFGGFPGAVTYS